MSELFFSDINIEKCKYCDKLARYHIRNKTGQILFAVCLVHYTELKNKISLSDNRNNEDKEISLNNFGKTSTGEVLFKSKSFTESGGKFSFETWRDFGKKLSTLKNKSKKYLEEHKISDDEREGVELFLWDIFTTCKKQSIIIMGEKMIDCISGELHYIFTTKGRPLYKTNNFYSPIESYQYLLYPVGHNFTNEIHWLK